MMRRRWPLFVLGAAGVAAHVHELLGKRPYFRDTHQVYVPAKMYLAERLRAGELPSWWPWDGGGSPLIPQPTFSVFHPTTLLYLVLPFWSAFNAQNLCATWGALFGAYVLGRVLGLSRPAALVSGALYGLNGYVCSLGEHQFMMLAAATMPWYLAALLRADRLRGAWIVAPSAMMALLLLAGDPQIAILSAASGLVLLVAVARRWVLAVLSPIAGAVLAAVQVLPSLAVVPETERGHAMQPERWALASRHLLGLFRPSDFGQDDWARSTLVGCAGLGLVAASVVGLQVARKRGVLLALWTLVIGSVWLSLGDAGGLNRLARAIVPLWGQLRYPMKSIVLAYLALAVLAGFGFSHLQTRRLRRTSFTVACVVLVATLASSLGSDPVTLLSMAAAMAAVVMCRPALGATVFAAHTTALALPLFLVISPDFYEPSTIARALQRDGVGPTGGYFERPFRGTYDDDLQPLACRAAGGGLGTSFGAIHHLPSLSSAQPGASWRVLSLFHAEHAEVMDARLLGVFGVSDVVLSEPLNERERREVVAEDPGSGFAAVRLRHRLDRAYVTPRARSVPDDEAARAAVTAAEFKPGHEVIVETRSSDPSWSQRADSPAIPATVEPRTRSDEVRVRASLPWPGFVVLNETWFPGWSATVDGQPTPVLAANSLVRAVEAPAGDHEIVFKFQTPGLRAGAWISAVAWLLLGVLSLVARASYRIRVPHEEAYGR